MVEIFNISKNTIRIFKMHVSKLFNARPIPSVDVKNICVILGFLFHVGTDWSSRTIEGRGRSQVDIFERKSTRVSISQLRECFRFMWGIFHGKLSFQFGEPISVQFQKNYHPKCFVVQGERSHAPPRVRFLAFHWYYVWLVLYTKLIRSHPMWRVML